MKITNISWYYVQLSCPVRLFLGRDWKVFNERQRTLEFEISVSTEN